MKQKYEGKDLQGLVDLGREQGYLTFEQVNDFLPQDVASPTDLRAALDSFEDLDIKVLDEVPTEGADEVEVETKEEAEEAPEAPAPAADSLGESSDPVRLYLKEMGNFQLLSREQEVEIAKRIEAGENEVEEEVLGSPIMLDFVIRVGERVEAGEADLRDMFEDAAENAGRSRRGTRTRSRRASAQEAESRDQKADRTARQDRGQEELRNKPGPRRKPKLDKDLARYSEREKKELRAMGFRGAYGSGDRRDARHPAAVPPRAITLIQNMRRRPGARARIYSRKLPRRGPPPRSQDKRRAREPARYRGADSTRRRRRFAKSRKKRKTTAKTTPASSRRLRRDRTRAAARKKN